LQTQHYQDQHGDPQQNIILLDSKGREIEGARVVVVEQSEAERKREVVWEERKAVGIVAFGVVMGIVCLVILGVLR
jgi:hypothetical protein